MADFRRLPPPQADHWDWQLDAACRGMDSSTFFHPTEEHRVARQRRIDAAKEICAACPVLTDCRSYALRTREAYGIWGGLSEFERAIILGLRSLRYPAKEVRDYVTTQSDPIHFQLNVVT